MLPAGARAASPKGHVPSPASWQQEHPREVLGVIAQGHTNAAIADELVLTRHAVEKHFNSILTKLGLSGDPDTHPRVRVALLYLRRRRRHCRPATSWPCTATAHA